MCVSVHTALESSQHHNNEGFPFFTSIQDLLRPRKALVAVLMGCQSQLLENTMIYSPKAHSCSKNPSRAAIIPPATTRRCSALPGWPSPCCTRRPFPRAVCHSALHCRASWAPMACSPEAVLAQRGTAQLQVLWSLLLPPVLQREQKSAEAGVYETNTWEKVSCRSYWQVTLCILCVLESVVQRVKSSAEQTGLAGAIGNSLLDHVSISSWCCLTSPAEQRWDHTELLRWRRTCVSAQTTSKPGMVFKNNALPWRCWLLGLMVTPLHIRNQLQRRPCLAISPSGTLHTKQRWQSQGWHKNCSLFSF